MKGRWKDLFSLHEIEVPCSLCLSIVVCIFLTYLDFFNDFKIFEAIIQSISLGIIGGMIGLLGFALSGIAIIVSLFSEKQVKVIEKSNGPNVVERIMSSFVFLAICSFINIIFLAIIAISISSSKEVVGSKILYVICFIVLYFFFFTLLYTISLIYGCIELFTIKKVYSNVERKDFFHKVNEIRINFILVSILKKYGISEKTMVEELERMVDDIEDPEKELIKEYFHKTYLP